MRPSVKKRRIQELMQYALASAKLGYQLDSMQTTEMDDHSSFLFSSYESDFDHCFAQYMALAEGLLSDTKQDAMYLYRYAYNQGMGWINSRDRASESIYNYAYYDDQDIAPEDIIAEQDEELNELMSSLDILPDDSAAHSHNEQVDEINDEMSRTNGEQNKSFDELTFARAFKEAYSRIKDVYPLNIKTRHTFFSSPNPALLMPLPLHTAVCKNKIKTVKALLEDHTLANATDLQGNTALHQACARNFFPIIKTLLQHNVNTSIVNKQGLTALQEAIERRQTIIISLLLKHGLRKIEFLSEKLKNMISDTAALCKHPEESVDFLLRLNENGLLTLNNLHDLCKVIEQSPRPTDCVESIIFLHKENLLQTYLQNYKTTDPLQLLHEAIAAKDAEFVNQLIAAKFDIKRRDHHHRTPLHTSIIKGNINTTCLLLFSGSDIMARDNNGWQPLHFASRIGDIDVVNAILEAIKGDIRCINSTTLDGQTPLMIANRYKQHKVSALLQDYQSFRARLSRINFHGEIPDHMKCCISLEIINDPITVSSGITYDRAQLSRYFGNKNQVDCPITKQRIDREELKFKTSVFLNGLIEAFVTEQENMFKSRSALIEEETSAEARFVP